MSSFSYEAVDSSGLNVKGIIEVTSQSHALRRIKEMGLFPTSVRERRRVSVQQRPRNLKSILSARPAARSSILFGRGVKPKSLTAFTRQLATLLEAGMPLLRGLRLLERQDENRRMASAIEKISRGIEEGETFSQALAAQPKVFDALYLNLVKAGEASGALETVLNRLAHFREKSQRMKSKVIAAMFYPVSVLLVAICILAALMVFVVPRFKEVFDGLLGGAPMPAFTVFVLNLSEICRDQAPLVLLAVVAFGSIVVAGLNTPMGRRWFDALKLRMPVLGNVFRKVAVARFTRTLATLLGNGVPVLQSLTIAQETAGNLVVARVVADVHECVKEGDPIAPTLKASKVFPPIVAGMVDVGEQTGALPEMLAKIADNYDEEVDNAVTAMTSLIEPIMIVLLAVIVGSIVIALFLPIISFGELM